MVQVGERGYAPVQEVVFVPGHGGQPADYEPVLEQLRTRAAGTAVDGTAVVHGITVPWQARPGEIMDCVYEQADSLPSGPRRILMTFSLGFQAARRTIEAHDYAGYIIASPSLACRDGVQRVTPEEFAEMQELTGVAHFEEFTTAIDAVTPAVQARLSGKSPAYVLAGERESERMLRWVHHLGGLTNRLRLIVPGATHPIEFPENLVYQQTVGAFARRIDYEIALRDGLLAGIETAWRRRLGSVAVV